MGDVPDDSPIPSAIDSVKIMKKTIEIEIEIHREQAMASELKKVAATGFEPVTHGL